MNPSFSRAWVHESNVYVKRLAKARRTCFRTDIQCDIGRRSRPESQLRYAHCFVFAAYFQRQCVMLSGGWTEIPRGVRNGLVSRALPLHLQDFKHTAPTRTCFGVSVMSNSHLPN